jgi:hypothetical protein
MPATVARNPQHFFVNLPRKSASTIFVRKRKSVGVALAARESGSYTGGPAK